MFCKNCGKEISDTVKFCAFCGTPVEAVQVPVMPVIPLGAFDAGQNSEVQGEENGEDILPDDDATVVLTDSRKNTADLQDRETEENVVPQSEVIPVVPLPVAKASDMSGPWNGNVFDAGVQETPVKKSHAGIVLLGLAGIVVIAVVCLLFRTLFGGSSDEFSKVAYLKDNELSMVLNMKASEPDSTEITETKNASNLGYSAVRFSPDGSYLYYFSKVNSEDGTGTLCRVPTAQIKKDASENEKLEEEIDKRVFIDYEIIGNTSVLYRKDEDELLFYTEGEEYELTDSLGNYAVTEDKTHVVYSDQDKTLYIQKLEKGSEAKEIDSNVESFASYNMNHEFVVYGKDYDEEENIRELYVGGIGRKPELIAENVDNWNADLENQSVYYFVKKTEKNALASYVKDSYAEKDGSAAKPAYIDYFAAERNYPELSADDEGEYTQEEFMEMISYNYDYTFDMNYYYNDDNEKTYYYNEENEKWYTDFDREKYDQAVQDYEAAQRRQELRQELQTADAVEDFYYELYYYKDGKSSEVCDSVGQRISSCDKGVIYTKKETGKAAKTYDINDISSVDNLRNRIQSGGTDDDSDHTESESGGERERQVYFCSIRGNEEEEVTEFETINALYVSDDGKNALIAGDYEDSGNLIMAYGVSGSGLGKGEKIAERGSVAAVNENIFYYYEEIDEDEAELYSYDGSQTKLLAKDMYMEGGGFIADEGAVIGYTDFDYDSGGDLCTFGEDGKGERIAKDVQGYVYLGSGTYLLWKDWNLYYLNKAGEEVCLVRDIRYYWYPDDLQPGILVGL